MMEKINELNNISDDEVFEVDTRTAERIVESHMFDLGELLESKEDELKLRIANSNGSLRVVVHPFFEDYRKGNVADVLLHKMKEHENPHRIPSKRRIRDVFYRMLRMDKTKTAPIFILEEGHHIPKLKETLIEDVGLDMQNDLFVTPTVPNNSIPRNTKKFGGDWNSYNKYLADLGVKNIIVGGTYLSLKSEPIKSGDDRFYYDQCVGNAVVGLSERFDVQLSQLSYPMQRTDDRQNKGEIKSRAKS
jgi:hypothetical protein